MAEDTINRTRRIRLGYLQTVQALANELDLYTAGGVQSQREKRELTFTDQKTTFIPGTNGAIPGSTTVESHGIGDTGWVKDDEELITMYDRARISVGVRDLTLGQIRYAADGLLISKPYETLNPIRAVSIVTNEYIHPSLPTAQYIIYSISFDGTTWTEVLPSNTALIVSVPKRLTVNFDDAEDDNSEKVSVEGKPKKVYLKIEFARPDDVSFVGTTPILRHFDLHVEVEKL